MDGEVGVGSGKRWVGSKWHIVLAGKQVLCRDMLFILSALFFLSGCPMAICGCLRDYATMGLSECRFSLCSSLDIENILCSPL